MTTAAERSIALHRGKTMAALASASRVRALEHNGLSLVWLDDITVIVERQYRFNLAASSWCRIDDHNVHGYLVATLLKDFRKRNSEKPVGGRDSAAPGELTSGNSLPAVAESSAGSSAMVALMERAPWP